jgi:hypothetical protein
MSDNAPSTPEDQKRSADLNLNPPYHADLHQWNETADRMIDPKAADHPGNPNQVTDSDLCAAIADLMDKHPDWNLHQLALVLRAEYGVTQQFVRQFYQVFIDAKRSARRKRGH